MKTIGESGSVYTVYPDFGLTELSHLFPFYRNLQYTPELDRRVRVNGEAFLKKLLAVRFVDYSVFENREERREAFVALTIVVGRGAMELFYNYLRRNRNTLPEHGTIIGAIISVCFCISLKAFTAADWYAPSKQGIYAIVGQELGIRPETLVGIELNILESERWFPCRKVQHRLRVDAYRKAH